MVSTTSTALVTQLLEAREDRQLQRLLTQLQKQDLLILDELGYVPFSKAGSELLFTYPVEPLFFLYSDKDFYML